MKPPALSTRTKGLSLLATLVTLLVVVAVLVVLLMNGACTGMFLNPPPRGDQAMGLIIPFFGLAGGIIVLTLASIIAAFSVNSSAVGTITSSPFLSGVIVIALTFGAALAAGMAFMLWCDAPAVGVSLKVVTVPIGMLAGVLGPVLLAVMLLIGVWMSKSSATAALASGGGGALGLRAGFFAVCFLALTGYGLGGSMFWKEIQRVATNRAAAAADVLKEHARWHAEGRKSPKQRLTEELSRFSPDSPLWTIIAYLPDQPGSRPLDEECRAIVVRRALQVSDLDAELVGCMQSRYYLYRQAAAEFLISVPELDLSAHRDAWARALIVGLEATSDGIYCRPAWLTETFDSKPDPLGHVRSLINATARFKDTKDHALMRQHLETMAYDAGMLNADANREKLLRLLADAGYQPPSVRPASSR